MYFKFVMGLETETQRHLAPRPFDFGCRTIDIFSCPTVLLELRGAYFGTPHYKGVTRHKNQLEFFFFFFSPWYQGGIKGEMKKIEGRHFKNFCLLLKCQPLVDEKNPLYKVNSKYTKKIYLDHTNNMPAFKAYKTELKCCLNLPKSNDGNSPLKT